MTEKSTPPEKQSAQIAQSSPAESTGATESVEQTKPTVAKKQSKQQKATENTAKTENQEKQTQASNKESEKKPLTESEPSSIKKPSDTEKELNKVKKSSTATLSIVTLLLMIAMGGGFYLYDQQQKQTLALLQDQLNSLQLQVAKPDTVQQEINQLKQAQQQLSDNLLSQVKEQQKLQSSDAKNSTAITILDKDIQALHEKISALSTSDNSTWLISQADYLIKLAGRKIWNDQDYVTALLLLKSADSSIAETNDPSLLPLRNAINRDMTTLSGISQIDFDGIVLRLNQLSAQIISLPLYDNSSDDGSDTDYYDTDSENSVETDATTEHRESGKLTQSLADWKENIGKNWRTFTAKFVTITKRNTLADCLANASSEQAVSACSTLAPLILPEQDVYLRENLRMQLFIAAQSVPRHQYAIYQQSLDNVATWVRAYFDQKSPQTSAFLKELDELSQLSFDMNVPTQLESLPMLDKLMQTRVRNLLSQPTNTNIGG